MDKFIVLPVVNFVTKILVSQAIARDENSVSSLIITRNRHRWLKRFTFNTFHSVSLASCALNCQLETFNAFQQVQNSAGKVSSLDEYKECVS